MLKTITYTSAGIEAKYFTHCEGRKDDDVLEVIDGTDKRNHFVFNKNNIDFLEKILKEIKSC